jgi:Na+-transporting NADH:ubiquinone oxidoreductase subunit NqrC
MKLNTNSNSYIIIYSAILVVIVAFLLAFVYQALKPMQDANVALDVKKQILYSLNIRDLDGAEAEAKYAEVVVDEQEQNGQKTYFCQIDGKKIQVVYLKGMAVSAVILLLMVKERYLVPTSTMKVRLPVWVPKSKTHRLGRKSSLASKSGTKTAT